MPSERLVGRVAAGLTFGCLALVLLTTGAFAIPGVRAWFGFARAVGYTVGDQIDVPPGLYETSAHTLLIFTRSNCPACQAARPAMRELVSALRAHPSVAERLVTPQGHNADEVRYATDVGLDATHVVALGFSGLRFESVPTTVLVDRTGQILYAFESAPSATQRAELLQLVIQRGTGR